jgi:hypothetical protein
LGLILLIASLDDRAVANFIYGHEKDLPPVNPKDKGHYHPECAQFWLIMSGQIRCPIEGQGVIIANVGDVVYVPPFTFHARAGMDPAHPGHERVHQHCARLRISPAALGAGIRLRFLPASQKFQRILALVQAGEAVNLAAYFL